MSGPRVDIVTDEAGFAGLGPAWAALSSPRVADNPFLSHAWNRVCAERRGRGTELFTVTLLGPDGGILGIAPLALESSKAGPISFKRLCFIGEGVSDYHDFIVRDDDPVLMDELWSAVGSTSSRWDIAALADFPAGSPTLVAVGGRGRHGFRVERASLCPKMDLPASWDEMAGRLPARLVKDAAYQERRLERAGTLEYREVGSKDGVEPFMEELFRLHEQRWARNPTPSKFLKEAARSRAVAHAAAMFDSGYAAYSSLVLGSETIAAHFGFGTPSTSYYYVPAYDPDYDKYSIGRALYFRALRAAIERGATRFDFLRGAEEYKLRWGGTECWNYEILASRRTPGAVAANALTAYRGLRAASRSRAVAG